MPVRRATLVAAALLGAALYAGAAEAPADLPGRIYRLDAAHSQMEFTARYLRLMEVRGRFREWDAAILNPEDPARGAVAVVFKTASLDTGNETRDAHLKSGDFFDAERWPTATFVATRIERRGEGWVARGTLEMHGERKPIDVPFRPAYAPTTDGRGNARSGFVGSLALNRRDFGIEGGNRFNSGFDPLVSIIDDEVRIDFSIHGTVPPLKNAAVDSVLAAIDAGGVADVVRGWNAVAPAGEDDAAKTARGRAGMVFHAVGYRLIFAGRNEDALEMMRLAALVGPGNARFVASLGEAYARLGRTAPALENVEKALALDPAETRALIVRAWLAS